MPSGATLHRWSELPAEIQLKVLSLELIFEEPITWTMHHTHSHQVLLPLALANRHLHNLTTEMYYGENTFVIQRSWYKRDTQGQEKDSYKAFRYPNPRIAQGVRKLQLHILADWRWIPKGSGLFRNSQLLFLFCPENFRGKYLRLRRDTVERMPDAEWQVHFQHLKEMKVILRDPQACMGDGGQRAVKFLRENTNINLRARHVEIMVFPKTPLAAFRHEEGRDVVRIDRLVATIKEMIKPPEEYEGVMEHI